MKKSIKNAILIGSCVIVIGSCSYYYYTKNNQTKKEEIASITYSVVRGDLSKTVTASGNLEASQTMNLSFTGNSKVTKVHVQSGETVTKGQILAEMDETVLNNSLLSAQASYDSAVAKQKNVARGTDDNTISDQKEQVAKTKAELASATTSLSDAKKLANSDYLQEQLVKAKEAVEKAQTGLNVAKETQNQSSILFAQVEYDNAQSAYKQAATQRNNLSSLKEQVTKAQTTVDNATRTYNQALNKLEELQEGPEESEIASAKANVAQELAKLNEAKANVAGAKIYAPFDGIISGVGAKEGESLSANTAAITMFSTEGAYKITTSIDDTDITEVAVDQEVDITFDALSGVTLKGKVISKAVLGEVQSTGTVTFPVIVEVNEGQENEDKLIPGLGATLSIITDGKSNVLQVPDAAIKSFGGKKIVMVEKNGEEVQTEITTGLDDGANSEVLTGISEGDKVKITITTSSASNTTQSGFGALSGIGGGGNFERPSGGGMLPSGASTGGGRQ